MRWSVCVLVLLGGMGPSVARADLLEYVKRPEPAYAWKLKEKIQHPLGTVYDLHLVSQVWQGITWEHQLQVYQPPNAVPGTTMLLWNTGGGANTGNQFLGMDLARRLKAPVAFLYHIPNQPLLGGKKEDALIAETFVRFLETRDENWPLLFPMAKSVLKAMDALQAFSKEQWQKPVEQFIITGASKRGWTSWMAAATGDPRIKAIAPMVIDTLNMQQQLPHQLEAFGRYSEMIKDYTERGLVPLPQTPEGKRLWSMVDPWVYRDRITQPKLLLLGNNDPYWSADALNLYWDDLKGDKWVTYVPNAGHNLQQRDAEGKQSTSRALNALVAFVRHQTINNPMPRVAWKHEDAAGKLRLTVTADQPPLAARLWVAQAPTQDFRKAAWEARPAQVTNGTVVGEVTPPASGYVAFYADLEYEMEGTPFQVTTQLRVAGKGNAAKE